MQIAKNELKNYNLWINKKIPVQKKKKIKPKNNKSAKTEELKKGLCPLFFCLVQ